MKIVNLVVFRIRKLELLGKTKQNITYMYIQYIFSQIYQPETPKGLIDFYNLKNGNDDDEIHKLKLLHNIFTRNNDTV